MNIGAFIILADSFKTRPHQVVNVYVLGGHVLTGTHLCVTQDEPRQGLLHLDIDLDAVIDIGSIVAITSIK